MGAHENGTWPWMLSWKTRLTGELFVRSFCVHPYALLWALPPSSVAKVLIPLTAYRLGSWGDANDLLCGSNWMYCIAHHLNLGRGSGISWLRIRSNGTPATEHALPGDPLVTFWNHPPLAPPMVSLVAIFQVGLLTRLACHFWNTPRISADS